MSLTALSRVSHTFKLGDTGLTVRGDFYKVVKTGVYVCGGRDHLVVELTRRDVFTNELFTGRSHYYENGWFYKDNVCTNTLIPPGREKEFLDTDGKGASPTECKGEKE